MEFGTLAKSRVRSIICLISYLTNQELQGTGITIRSQQRLLKLPLPCPNSRRRSSMSPVESSPCRQELEASRISSCVCRTRARWGLLDGARHFTGCHLAPITRVKGVLDDEGLMDNDCHVIGCHLTQETRFHNTFDDEASTIHQSLVRGLHAVRSHARDGAPGGDVGAHRSWQGGAG